MQLNFQMRPFLQNALIYQPKPSSSFRLQAIFSIVGPAFIDKRICINIVFKDMRKKLYAFLTKPTCIECGKSSIFSFKPWFKELPFNTCVKGENKSYSTPLNIQICDVICKKVSYEGIDIIEPEQTPRNARRLIRADGIYRS